MHAQSSPLVLSLCSGLLSRVAHLCRVRPTAGLYVSVGIYIYRYIPVNLRALAGYTSNYKGGPSTAAQRTGQSSLAAEYTPYSGRAAPVCRDSTVRSIAAPSSGVSCSEERCNTAAQRLSGLNRQYGDYIHTEIN